MNNELKKYIEKFIIDKNPNLNYDNDLICDICNLEQKIINFKKEDISDIILNCEIDEKDNNINDFIYHSMADIDLDLSSLLFYEEDIEYINLEIKNYNTKYSNKSLYMHFSYINKENNKNSNDYNYEKRLLIVDNPINLKVNNYIKILK